MNPDISRDEDPAGSPAATTAAGGVPPLTAGNTGSARAAMVLVTADEAVRRPVRRSAARAGAYLADYPDLASVQQHGVQVTLLLLGADLAADLAAAAAEVRLPRAQERIVMSASPPDFATFATAAALGATYMTVASTDRGWLTEQMSTVAAGTLDRLRGAGFRLGHTDLGTVEQFGRVQAVEVSRWRQDDAQAVYVSLEAVARGDHAAGQSSSVDRSNYRTLHRRYPGLWTDLVSSSVTALGALVADLPPAVVDLLCGLRHGHPVLDEDDLADLEQQDLAASRRQVTSGDVRRVLGERARDVWDALEPEVVDQLGWDTVAGTGAWPDHDGRTVRWDLDRLVPAFAARLLAEFRRTWRPDPRYLIERLDPPRGWLPGWQVRGDGSVIAAAYSRHAARVAVWHHQRTTRN